MFVQAILESFSVELLNGCSDIPLPAANVELSPSVMEVLAPSEIDLNFRDSDLAHLTRIDISPQSKLWDPNKYVFSKRARVEAPTGEGLILFWPSNVACYSIKVLAIVIFGLSSLP